MALVAVSLVAAAHPAPARGQSALDRSPNLHGGWTGSAGTMHFNFLHRFNHSGAPERQVQNRPTFLLAYAPASAWLLGIHYATRSALVPNVPNEWEPFVRIAIADAARHPVDAGVQLAWNAAARSPDAELTLGRRLGIARMLAVVRVLGRDAASGNTELAAGAGAALRLHENAALAGDITQAAAGTTWSAGLQLRIPATPHTLSLHATNADAVTAHSASRPAARTRWGFEFTVPITLARYFATARDVVRHDTDTPVAPVPPQGDSVVIRARIHNLQYVPDTVRVAAGAVVEWRNDDPLAHTVTAEDGSWDSGEIPPGGVWRRRFLVPGRFLVTCTPHPFMRAVLIVE
ncbi:MAG TPA: hypothetical protein VK929_07510 [Longimicrobiales bacterium]|nr:hypothetical protein [Longimicrobiales bacterium]